LVRWDNAKILSEKEALAEPDMNHIYSDKEFWLRQASTDWGWRRRSDGSGYFDDTVVRSAHTEMVHLRARRNERNRQRREDFKLNPHGMQQYQADTLPLT
jgi:hypothetical protein